MEAIYLLRPQKLTVKTTLTGNISTVFLVQRIVDASGLYLSVATGFPGSLHDAWMLHLTNVYWAAEDENILMEPTFDLGGTVVHPLIVGDTAHPNKTWLIRPFKDTGGLMCDHRKFNREVSKARIE